MAYDYNDVVPAASGLVGRFVKAIASGVAAASAVFGTTLAVDGNYKTALVAAALSLIGGFGFTAVAPANKPKV